MQLEDLPIYPGELSVGQIPENINYVLIWADCTIYKFCENPIILVERVHLKEWYWEFRSEPYHFCSSFGAEARTQPLSKKYENLFESTFRLAGIKGLENVISSMNERYKNAILP